MYKYLFITLLLLSTSSVAAAKSQSGAATEVKASIPSKVDIRIFGYTAPNSLVQAESIRVFAQVSSDKSGYYIIDPLPVSTQAKEICLTTIDSEKRSGFPVCISMPDITKATEIGPVLLSPTLSLSSNSFIQSSKQQSSAFGKSLADAQLEISFFENSALSLTGIFIPTVEAKTIAKITTKTDETGSYSINLPAEKVATYRLFARAFYENAPTPNSQILGYSVISYTNYWLKNILPRLILLLLFFILLGIAVWYEKKTKKGRVFLAYFSERQLKPFGVRSRLTLRRIWYNCRGYLRKDQI